MTVYGTSVGDEQYFHYTGVCYTKILLCCEYTGIYEYSS
jgi:uncharacterized membrane protein